MMLHQKSSSFSNQQAVKFLEQNPSLSCSLLAECNHNLDQVKTLVEPILQATKRCELTSYYIQAVIAGRLTFLSTNISQTPVHVTEAGSTWLIGRNSSCAIAIPHSSISRRHAVFACCPEGGFYITDIGSSNGTWVNYSKLTRLERCVLRDGDLIQLGSMKLEFFILGGQGVRPVSNDATYY